MFRTFARLVTSLAVFSVFISVFLFIGYIYALQSNPTLYIPGFSEKANNFIKYVWGKPYTYPTPSTAPSVLNPQFMAPELTGITSGYKAENIKLANYRSKQVVLLWFGRLACDYCFNVITYLNEWKRNYSDIQVIGVIYPKYDYEKDWNAVVKKLDERGTNFPVVYDENSMTMRLYNPDFVPVIYVIDKAGKIQFTHYGEGNFAEVENAFKEVLKTK